MHRVSKDGITYRLNDNGVAAYLFSSGVSPKESRVATEKEASIYDHAHKSIWEKVIKNMGLGRHIAKIFCIHDEHVVIPITIDTLLRCIERHDSTRSKFSTYASRALYRSFQRHRRNEKRLYAMPLDDEFEFVRSGGKVQMYAERRFHKTVLDSAHFDFLEHEDKDAVQFLMESLDEYDRRLLLLVYWKGLTIQQLADVLGVAKSTAWIDMQRILTLCRRIMKCE